MGRSLYALFGSLLAGCGPVVGVAAGTGTSGTGDEGHGDPSATTLTSTTIGTTTSAGETGTTGTTGMGEAEVDDGAESILWDHNCSDRIFVDVVEIPLSLIAEWIDRNGQIDELYCEDACQAADIYGSIVACSVEDVGGSSESESSSGSSSGSSSSGSSSGTTGDETVLLRCEWMKGCGIGRGHDVVRSRARARGGDPIARWAACAAHAEAASVGAFLALRHELAAHGAPRELCERMLAAARDEIGHARAMSRIAAQRGAVPERARFDRVGVRSLEAIAIENAIEGCVRETWSALEACAQAREAADSEIRRAMRRIAIDETRHAELAHDLARWLDAQLDDAARARVRTARDAAVEELLGSLAATPPDSLQRLAGLPEAARARRLAEGLRARLWS
ncbi:MAG TPA: ferritin-like domain-containing protein [Nannocystaceae bacterium]|nr:ferritin-like domain-containing protein [Nannocystaceae bacterium]